MGPDVMTQRAAWKGYNRFFEDARVDFMAEPSNASELGYLLERLSLNSRPSPKLWSDAYLGAFAMAAGFTLVSFDRALRALPGISVQIL